MNTTYVVALIASHYGLADDLAQAVPPEVLVRVSNFAQTRTWGVLQNPTPDADYEYEARRVLARNPLFFVKPLLARVEPSNAARVMIDLIRSQDELDFLVAWCERQQVCLTTLVVGDFRMGDVLPTSPGVHTLYFENPHDIALDRLFSCVMS